MYYDSTIPRWIGLFFILQKFGVTEYEVQRALLSNDPHDQLNIAYHLIVDNRRLAGEGKNILFSKSPIKNLDSLLKIFISDQGFTFWLIMISPSNLGIDLEWLFWINPTSGWETHIQADQYAINFNKMKF